MSPNNISGEKHRGAGKKKTGAKRNNTVIRIILSVITGIIAGMGALAVSGIHFMFSIWFGTVEELVFTLTNLSGASSEMVWSFILKCGVLTVCVMIAYALLTIFCFGKGKPGKLHIWNAAVVLLSLVSIFFNLKMAYDDLHIADYLKNQQLIADEEAEAAEDDQADSGSDENGNKKQSFIDSQYVNPTSVSITAPEKKRNLILIYLESMEMTYADTANGGAYDINYIPELTELSEKYENFSGNESGLNGAEVLTYSTWTMGGIFAHSAGLPLNLPIGRNQMDSQEVFLPSVTALGDILAEDGYRQSFLCGSDAEFGGRKAYFSTHGNYDFYDLYYAWENGIVPDGRKVFWGFEDEILFQMAKDELTEIASSSDEPFNFTMLTVDTHYPDGYRCDLCGTDLNMRTSDGYTNIYGNALACSSRQVSEFIDWIQQQDFYENTTVVLLGDHLTMDTHFCSDVPESYTRKTFVSYINSAVEPELDKKRQFVTEDSFPTILASLGYDIEGDRLGLGVNLFSDQPTLLEQYGFEYLDKEISKKSNLLDEIGKEVDLDAAAEEYNVHNCEVSVPVIDTNENTMTIKVSDIYSSSGVNSVYLKAYTNENMSDAKFLYPELQEDGTYVITIDLNSFYYNPEGVCTIAAYCRDDYWATYFMNDTTVKLQTPINV